MMSSDDDELARLNAEMDQAISGMRDMGRACGVLYRQLLEEGFDGAEALTLTATWINGMTPDSRPSE